MTGAAEDALRAAEHIAREKNITLTRSLQNHALICGDYGRIRQLMLILLDNAIKFSPQSGRVDVALRCSADTCTFTVSDQGPGISKEALPYIFDRFYTSADPANPQGTGLGLFIAKQVAARHGAELCAENLPDSGSRFTFTCRRYDPDKSCTERGCLKTFTVLSS